MMDKEKFGSLEIVCGSMFSGKTEELMRRLRRAEYSQKNVLTIKHKIDDRYSFSCIASHSGQKRAASPINTEDGGVNTILLLADETIDVVGIDELHFFPDTIVEIIQQLVEKGKRVIGAGLDMDFRGEPFGIVPTLMSLADSVTKKRAICLKCGEEATFSQRLINGEAASYDDPSILVGGEECYEARCRACFQTYKQAALV